MKIYLRNTLLIVFTIALISNKAFSDNRYWVANTIGNWNKAVKNNWNNTANWSDSSGGIRGVSIPDPNDSVIFDGNGLGNCTLDSFVHIDGLTINGYTGVIDLSGFTFISSGGVRLKTGSIINIPGKSGFIINSTDGTSMFSGTTISTVINVTSSKILLNGSTFNNMCIFTKTGTNNDNGAGGNIFNRMVAINNYSLGLFSLGNIKPDIFNGDLIVMNSGSNSIHLAHASSGNQFNGNVLINSIGKSMGVYFGNGGGKSVLSEGHTISIGDSGFTSGNLYIKNLIQIGYTPQKLTVTDSSKCYIENSTWNGNVRLTTPDLFLRGSRFRNGFKSIRWIKG